MKFIFLTSFVLFSLLFLPLNISAKSPSPKPIRGLPRIEQIEKLENRFEKKRLRLELKKNSEEKRASRAARLAEKRKKRIKAFFARLTRRLNAAITRLERLITRIESRLAKINEEEDIDISSIQAQVAQAKDLVEQAKAALSLANASYEEVLSSEDPKAAFAVVRETIKEVKDLLIEAHRTLVHAIGDIKGLRVGKMKKPSSAVSPIPIPSP